MIGDPTAADLKIFYSGGGSNSNTTLSIGGAISSTRVLSQTGTPANATLTGVTIDDCVGNAVGSGTLSYVASTKTLSWQPYLGSVGAGVDISANGSYFIQGGGTVGGGVCITVVAASLPTSNVSVAVAVVNLTEKFFLNQTKAESDAGVTKYHCFAIKNAHATLPIVGIKQYIAENTPGADTITLFLDAIVAGTGTVGPTAVANENTAPAASTFVSPDSATHADALAIGTLAAGQCRFFWIKQNTPAGISVETLVNTFKLGLYLRA